jgi:hypothetical protein
MKEFIPDRYQLSDLKDEMRKQTKISLRRSILFIVVCGIILLVLIAIGIPFGIPISFLLITGGLSAFGFLYAVWGLIYDIYSKIRDFENYHYYIGRVMDLQSQYTSSGTGGHRSVHRLFYLTYINEDGNKKRRQIEGDLITALEVGGEFIMAKGLGGKIFLPNIFESETRP